jgi:hypothetical protein
MPLFRALSLPSMHMCKRAHCRPRMLIETHAAVGDPTDSAVTGVA